MQDFPTYTIYHANLRITQTDINVTQIILRRITQLKILITKDYAGRKSITRKIFRVKGTYSSPAKYVKNIESNHYLWKNENFIKKTLTI